MDSSEKSSYHRWQKFDPSPAENQLNSSSPTPDPSVSMVDSYCSSFYPSGGWSGQGILPPSLSQFPADLSFIERAARFSCFNGGGSLSSVMADLPFPDGQNPGNDGRDSKQEDAPAAAAELGEDRQENSSSRGGSDSTKKRKRSSQVRDLCEILSTWICKL